MFISIWVTGFSTRQITISQFTSDGTQIYKLVYGLEFGKAVYDNIMYTNIVKN